MTDRILTVSIAMATYNGAKYLGEQLRSFTAQTHLPDELVVCDDYSTDDTVEILEKFSATAPFTVRIERNKQNIGHVKNFEKAMSLCTGDVIFLSDQDDFWLPKKIETQVRYLSIHPSCMVAICDLEICDENLVSSGKTKLKNLLKAGEDRAIHITGCAMAIRRSFLAIVLPIPANELGHDNWIGRLSNALLVKEVLADVLQLYRRHDENVSAWFYSRTLAMGQTDLIKEYGVKPAIAGWLRQAESLENARQRIAVANNQTKRAVYKEAIALLAQKANRCRERITLVSRPRLVRWPFIIVFWLRGGYRQFAGWKSAAKDTIRP